MENKLVEYLDGHAKPAERRAVEEHLAVCSGCRARAEEFRALWSALDDLPAVSPSPAFDASLRARLAAEPVHRGFWAWLPSPRLAFAVAALFVLSIWVSSLPQITHNQTATLQPAASDADFVMIRDLPVLENYDMISKFDALSELPVPTSTAAPGHATQEER